MSKKKVLKALRQCVIFAIAIVSVYFVVDYVTKEQTKDAHSPAPISKLSDDPEVLDYNAQKRKHDAARIEVISWEPRVLKYHNFLTPEECKEIIDLGKNHLSRSEVVSDDGDAVNDARTSKGVFFTYPFMAKSLFFRDIERRLAEWSQIPAFHGETFYLLRYQKGEQYEPHTDYFSEDKTGEPHIGDSGNRIATVLTYLMTPDEGGDTEFPNAAPGPAHVAARAGDSVLFWDAFPNGRPDWRSLHAGRPVISGEKWCMTKWIRANRTQYFWKWGLSDDEVNRLDAEDQAWREQNPRSSEKVVVLSY
jgi:prolyl 4-hydroxylase